MIKLLFFNVQWTKDIPKTENGSYPPIILVGSKSDLRKVEPNPEDSPHVTPAEAKACRKSIHARKYVECSAKEDNNIEAVFQAAMEAYLKPKSKGGCGCFCFGS